MSCSKLKSNRAIKLSPHSLSKPPPPPASHNTITQFLILTTTLTCLDKSLELLCRKSVKAACNRNKCRNCQHFLSFFFPQFLSPHRANYQNAILLSKLLSQKTRFYFIVLNCDTSPFESLTEKQSLDTPVQWNPGLLSANSCSHTCFHV